MAEGIGFTCDQCAHTITAWSDGNPYYIDDDGRKRYAYHPDHENLDRCIGNDEPHLCLACGKEFKEDSRKPRGRCPRCKEPHITPTRELDGKACPFCRRGRFRLDPGLYAIS